MTARAFVPGALLALIVLPLLVRNGLMIPAHVPLDPNEGWNAAHAMAAQLYPLPGSLMVNNYPPLSFWLVRALTALSGDAIVAGRVIAMAGFLLACAGIAAAVRRMGGTISGAGRYLKERNPEVKLVGVDPKGSRYQAEFQGGGGTAEVQPYLLEGVGQDFIPGTLALGLLHEVVAVEDKNAFAMARRLALEEGILAGGSAGAAVSAALRLAATWAHGALGFVAAGIWRWVG